MPVRTLNYTYRRRLSRHDVRITITNDNSVPTFDARFYLGSSRLPPDALVRVEAYRQTQWMRFDFGTVGVLRPPLDRRLTEFDSVEGVLFRVKVIASSEPRGLLIAEADQIRPRQAKDEEDQRVPLLPVVPNRELGDEIFRVEFDSNQTLLKVNDSLGDWRALARDPFFIALVYPAALRLILIQILLIEKHHDTEDMDDWKSRWLRFALTLPSVESVPEEESEDDDVHDWIDSAVAAFSKQQQIRHLFQKNWTGA